MSFYQKKILPIVDKKRFEMEQRTKQNDGNALCGQGRDILNNICKYLDLSSINRLYATCRHMKCKLELFKQDKSVYVHQNPYWSFDLYWHLAVVGDTSDIVKHRLKCYNTKSPDYYNNINKFGYNAVALNDVHCYVTEKYIFVMRKIADLYSISIYSVPTHSKMYQLERQYGLSKPLSSKTKFVSLYSNSLFINTKNEKQNSKTNKLKDPSGIYAFEMHGSDLIYVTGEGKVYICKNFEHRSKRKDLYQKREIASKTCIYGKYQKTEVRVPNEKYIQLLVTVQHSQDELTRMNSFCFSGTPTEDIFMYRIGSNEYNMYYFSTNTNRNVYVYNLSSKQHILKRIQPTHDFKICKDVVCTRETGRDGMHTLQTLKYSVAGNTFMDNGSLNANKIVDYAILPPNQNIVVCAEDGFIRLYDSTLKFIVIVGKRLYKTPECKLIISEDLKVLTLEKDEFGVSILTRHE